MTLTKCNSTRQNTFSRALEHIQIKMVHYYSPVTKSLNGLIAQLTQNCLLAVHLINTEKHISSVQAPYHTLPHCVYYPFVSCMCCVYKPGCLTRTVTSSWCRFPGYACQSLDTPPCLHQLPAHTTEVWLVSNYGT